MIHLTSYLNSIPLSVNPALVAMVVEAKQGCIIHFSGDKSIHVANNYQEVIKLLHP